MSAQVFFVVGHKNWGKSRTLRALTGGKHRYWATGTRTCFIRRMSNDDIETDWLHFISGINPLIRPHVIATFCPTAKGLAAVTNLSGKYDMYFWIMKHSFPNPALTVMPLEVQAMLALGTVDVFSPQQASEAIRAKAFEAFVVTHP